MRIDRIEITNFKAFTRLELDLHPTFNLLVGVNGAGKTSILDAIAVALGIWHVEVRAPGWRNIYEIEIHRRPVTLGDTYRFVAEPSAVILAHGLIDGHQVQWKRQIRKGGRRTTNAEAEEAKKAIRALLEREQAAPATATLPVLAYYSAARLGLPSRYRANEPVESSSGRERFDAYYHCLEGSIRHGRLNEWFLWAAVAAGQGQERAGHSAVRRAVMLCLPDCRALWFDPERKEIVADLGGIPVPYYSLSAGQRVMLAVAADIAIKAETLNPQLGSEMVERTPGIVMIDELDVHLHPSWQREVVKDLRRAFPSIQFICTSHSPQVFGELPPENILVCDSHTREWQHPSKSLGLDSSRILAEEMETSPRNVEEEAKLSQLSDAIDKENFPEAEKLLKDVEDNLGENDPEVTRARTLMKFLHETQ